MHEPDRLRRLWRLAFVAWLAALTALLLTPGSALPSDLGVGDKSLHAASYALLGALGLLAVRRARMRALVLGALACHAVGVELAQAFVPSRYVEGGDILANLVGLALGAALAGLVVATRRRA